MNSWNVVDLEDIANAEIVLKYSKILIFSVGIGCIVAFLFVFGVDLPWGKFSKMENTEVNMNVSEAHKKQSKGVYQPGRQVSNWQSMRQSVNTRSYESSDYYQIIVDNNIFRPLGWKPPNKEPEYTLLGTSFDPSGNRSEAFVLEERSNQFHTVSVGDKIGDAIIKEIAKKTVSLYKNGELITLNSRVGFLGNVGREERNSSNRSESNNQNVRNNDRSTRSKSVNINAERKRVERIIRENEKKFKAVMKEAANAEKKLEQAKLKMDKASVTFEGKKIRAVDLELKMKSK